MASVLLASQFRFSMLKGFTRTARPRPSTPKKVQIAARLEDCGPSKRFPLVIGDLHLKPYDVLPAPGDSDGQLKEVLANHLVPYSIGSTPGEEGSETMGQP
jgi:hypothetical protein